MLIHLNITNFAIIDRLEIEFGPGFNVLTGETGAGKSIILDAFGLLLGDRARPDLVRSGATEAAVEALFQFAGQTGLPALLADFGLPEGSADELVLRRLVQSGGRSRAYVNGALVTLAQLQRLAECLVTVCGQHEHQRLLQRETHLRILDSYGRHQVLVDDYRDNYRSLVQLRARLHEMDSSERDRQQRLDFLQHQSREIEAANLTGDEEEALCAERLLLQNAERLARVTESGYQILYGSDGAVCEQLGLLVGDLQTLSRIDADLQPLSETVARSLYDLEDVAAQLRDYVARHHFEPGRLEQIEERLAVLTRLKRKYAPTLVEILGLKRELDNQIEELSQAEQTRDELRRRLAELEAVVLDKGAGLSQKRREASQKLSAAVCRELSDLAMSGARFEVLLDSLLEPGGEGLERAEFMISANPGEPLMGLSRVVSGGELSRLMLALKRVAPDADLIPTVIFDEVDAGIGGETATAVGRKLQSVSRSAQVLCVTHLPQVAAFAEHHYQVSKNQESGRTLAVVCPLAGETRVREMARMLAGTQVGEQTLRHARELISASSGLP